MNQQTTTPNPPAPAQPFADRDDFARSARVAESKPRSAEAQQHYDRLSATDQAVIDAWNPR